jgi:uncharacterized protein YdiU (UPF0061 family)
VARSHIRVGTFQLFAARRDGDAVRTLADYVIDRLYPEAATAEQPYRALLAEVTAAQARLLAQWMLVGFVHGVMNTDNMSVAGETIDYGPCAFLDAYDPATVFSSIDARGRYAYGNQPAIALWNLARFAETLLPLLSADMDAAVAIAEEVLDGFGPGFEAAYRAGLSRKLGLLAPEEGDAALGQRLLEAMAANGADFTLTFRLLCDAAADPAADDAVARLFAEPAAYASWAAEWRARLAREAQSPSARRDAMRAANPAFIPRNHRVEAVIAAAVDSGDFSPFEELSEVLSRPYEDQPDFAGYALPPQESERVYRTFCGT